MSATAHASNVIVENLKRTLELLQGVLFAPRGSTSPTKGSRSEKTVRVGTRTVLEIRSRVKHVSRGRFSPWPGNLFV